MLKPLNAKEYMSVLPPYDILEHCLNPADLYNNCRFQFLKKAKFESREQFKVGGQVLTWAMHLIIKDIIENNDQFILPVPQAACWIELHTIMGEEFIKARQNGAFEDINFLKSGFKGHALKFRKQGKYIGKDKTIYVNGRLKRKLIDNTNAQAYG